MSTSRLSFQQRGQYLPPGLSSVVSNALPQLAQLIVMVSSSHHGVGVD